MQKLAGKVHFVIIYLCFWLPQGINLPAGLAAMSEQDLARAMEAQLQQRSSRIGWMLSAHDCDI